MWTSGDVTGGGFRREGETAGAAVSSNYKGGTEPLLGRMPAIMPASVEDRKRDLMLVLRLILQV